MADQRKTPTKRPMCHAQVVRKQWLTPQMVRVTVGGDGMSAFADNGYTDRYVKLLFRKPGVSYPEPFDIHTVRAELPREQWPTTRTYTVRSYDPVEAELSIDFVCHGDEGIAAPWAMRAEPSDELMFTGPGGAYSPDLDADWHLMVGDESALPAIGAALEVLPVGAPAYAFVEVADASEEQPLETPGKLEISWIHRSSSTLPPGDELVAAVRAFEFPAGDCHAFVHGEASFVKPLRRQLFDERAIERDRVSISGYWRRGTNEDGWQATKNEFMA